MRRERRLPSLPIKLLLVMAIGAILTLGCASAPTRHDGGEGQLKPLTIASIETPEGEHGVQVVIRASGPFSYSLSNHDRPPRILIEIPDGQFARLASHIPVNKGVVQAIDLQERGSQARVEIVLDRLVNYGVQKEENRLVLNFKDPMAAERQQEAENLPRPLVAADRPSESGGRPERPVPSPEHYARISPEPAAPTAGIGAANPLEYVIGALYILEINVYQEADLGGTFRVSADGHIPFPLLGAVQVAGLTPPQAQEKLEALLRDGYVKRPQVAVAVKEYRSKGVSVLGAVNKPGAYQLWGGRVTLLDLLAMAGGVNLEEGSKSLILLRPEANKETKSIAINLDRLLKEGDASLNLTVQPNDAIYVTKADAIIVYGEVKSPGTYALESQAMTVLEALSKAGGLTSLAAPNRTRIIRVAGGVEQTIRVRVGDIIAGERMKDIALQPGDVVVVPESYF